MSETEDLREAIARVLATTTLIDEPDGNTEWLQLADAVLALPQVAELRGKVEAAEKIASRLLEFDCEEQEPPRWIDVPDDYESGMNDAGRLLAAALASDPTTHESEGV